MVRLTPALTFIILFGLISLFSDMTHEGASSLRGAHFALLGASAATIGFVSGLGELIGYSLRYAFGRVADKTGQYWTLTIAGYALDIIAVPTLALVSEDGWIWACLLLLIQRLGKAVKKPAKDALMSFAATQLGTGKSFAIQEGLDQLGAFLGPVLLYVVMLGKTEGDTYTLYSQAFAWLAIPGALTLALLFYTRHRFPTPQDFEPGSKDKDAFKIDRAFIFYIVAISAFAFGFIDYTLILMHVSHPCEAGKTALLNPTTLPLLYAAAMIVDAVAALEFGTLYDKHGVSALVFSTLLSAPFAAFVFLAESELWIIAGIALWGIGMGAQESILKAVVADMVPKNARATGYGIFELSFGFFWFLGSWLLGVLYEFNLFVMVSVSIACQLIAIPLYIASAKTRVI